MNRRLLVAIAAVLLLAAWWWKEMDPVNSIVSKWADEIQRHEGWIPPGRRADLPNGSRSFRNNNPGNLRVTGDLGTDPQGFGRFSSYALGRTALERDLTAKLAKYPTWTIYQIMARYAPPSENDTMTYAQRVAAALGVSVETQLRDLVA